MNSHLIKQERCPNCEKQGKDISGDNLAIYSDGHTHCFSCGFHTNSDKITSYLQQSSSLIKKNEVYLPSDSDINYPQKVIKWIEQYELTKNDLLFANALWSDYKQRLLFPIYSPTGLLAYQGRYFGEAKEPKWYGHGDLKNTFHFLGQQGKPLIIVEDIISAIKLGKDYQSMPLFGNYIGTDRFKRLFKLIPIGLECIIWLDPDMRSHSIKQTQLGLSMGFNIRTIISDKDPKEHTYREIDSLFKGE